MNYTTYFRSIPLFLKNISARAETNTIIFCNHKRACLMPVQKRWKGFSGQYTMNICHLLLNQELLFLQILFHIDHMCSMMLIL